jgi:hypothetical protein
MRRASQREDRHAGDQYDGDPPSSPARPFRRAQFLFRPGTRLSAGQELDGRRRSSGCASSSRSPEVHDRPGVEGSVGGSPRRARSSTTERPDIGSCPPPAIGSRDSGSPPTPRESITGS